MHVMLYVCMNMFSVEFENPWHVYCYAKSLEVLEQVI